MHNTLLASGPDFRPGWTDEAPSGNVDLAPTILSLLNLKAQRKMDGRVLTEAFRNGKPAPAANSQTIEAQSGSWRQTLRLTTVGETTYFLEGNGGRLPKKP
jgi:arylsulfatase A-like enzyme